MRKTAFITLLLLGIESPAIAGSAHAHHSKEHPHVTCDMIRAYVATVGIEKAKATARAHGITAHEAQQARRCLANLI